MELDDLAPFLVLARELHFGRAAAQLDMSQSSLSRQIQALERTLRVRLLDRTTRRVVLTAAGAILLVEAPKVLQCFERVIDKVKAVGEQAPRRPGHPVGS